MTALQALMPAAFLSPRVHSLLSAAYGRLGDDNQERFEATLERAALASVLNSGDGTEESPWRVLMVSDEYDVLRALGHESKEQRLIQVGRRPVDLHVCNDGLSVFFDVLPLADLSAS